MSDFPNYMQRRGPFDLAPEPTFECRYGCGASFSLASSLKSHENYHARPELCCPYYIDCKYSTFTDNKLQDHIESFHYNTNRHRCPTCDFAGPTQSSLTKHRKTVHVYISGAIQAKDYTSTMPSPKKRTSTSYSRPLPVDGGTPPPKPTSNGPLAAHVTSPGHAPATALYPPPIRVLENDIINWPTTPPRK